MAIIKVRNPAIDLDAAEIPNLDAAKITTGTFADARMPSTVLNSNVDLTNLSATNLTSGTVPIARLGSSGTKDSTTFLRGDNTFATVSSAGLNLISSGNISGTVASLSLDNIFSSSYRNYKIIISELSTTNDSSNSQVYGRLLKYSDGSELSNNKYDWVTNGMYYSTSTGANIGNNGADNQNYFQMSNNNIDSDRAYASNYILDILNPFSTNSYTHLNIRTCSAHQDGSEFYSRYTWVRFKDNYDQGNYARGLKIYPSGGSLDNGYYRVYGYAD